MFTTKIMFSFDMNAIKSNKKLKFVFVVCFLGHLRGILWSVVHTDAIIPGMALKGVSFEVTFIKKESSEWIFLWKICGFYYGPQKLITKMCFNLIFVDIFVGQPCH